MMIKRIIKYGLLIFIWATFGKSWSPNEAFQFIFVTITFTSIMVGFFFFILGALKMGKLVRYIPYPVVGGFLAGTGWLIIKFAFIMTAEIEFSITNIRTYAQKNSFN